MDTIVLLAGATALLAALVQRITGLGFALVATAPMVLLFGPVEGVRVVVTLAFVASSSMLVTMWRDVEWGRSAWLIWPALITAPLAALVALVSPEPVLLLVVAAAAIFSLLAGRIRGLMRFLVGRPGAVVAGGSAGFLHVASGLSGPPLVAYADNEKWPQRSFAASVQVIFLAYNMLTIVWRGIPATPPAWLLGFAAVVVVGVVAGAFLARVIPARWARWAMFAVAWAGAIVVLVRGIMGLMGW